jgi:hypothetical protein
MSMQSRAQRHSSPSPCSLTGNVAADNFRLSSRDGPKHGQCRLVGGDLLARAKKSPVTLSQFWARHSLITNEFRSDSRRIFSHPFIAETGAWRDGAGQAIALPMPLQQFQASNIRYAGRCVVSIVWMTSNPSNSGWPSVSGLRSPAC